MNKRVTLTILLAILVLGAFFRFYLIAEIPPGLYPDEAMYGNNAQEALATGNFRVFYPENNGREGLYINMVAGALAIFGNEPWAIRLVSAAFGTLTILGIYLLTREIFSKNFRFSVFPETFPETVALLAAFFLATSFWHINFSRIGFRGILVPFFATFGMYFLLKGLRGGKILSLIWAGIFTGLGFHTYIAFRFMPFVLAVPLGWYLWHTWKPRFHLETGFPSCPPCAILLFLFVTFVVALPIGWYFLQNPQDFAGRAEDVSIFSTPRPAWEFVKSNAKTIGMFFILGDCNWRHNFGCRPFLILGITSLMGIAVLWRNSLKRELALLVGWLLFMSLPATLTFEGMPHALRSIGMIPPLIALQALGVWGAGESVWLWLRKERTKWPEYRRQLERIQKEMAVLFLLLLAALAFFSYWKYFVRWANNPHVYFAFSTDTWHLGQFLKDLPPEVKKYIVVNLPGVKVRGIPMSAKTVMFATDTFRDDEKIKKNIRYLGVEDIDQLSVISGEKTVIAFLNGEDRELIRSLKQKFPELKLKVPADFVILTAPSLPLPPLEF